MLVFVSIFTEIFLGGPALSPEVGLSVSGLVFHFVRWLQSWFRFRAEFLLPTRKLERFHIRDGELIAGLDLFQLAGIQMFEEMHVAVKFLGECVGGIAVRKEFLLLLSQLRRWAVLLRSGGPLR